MPKEIAAYSSEPIAERDLAQVLSRLKAERDARGWRLERKGAVVFIEFATEDLEETNPVILRQVAEEMGAWPVSKVFLFHGSQRKDGLDDLIARALLLALDDVWPIVTHDGVAARKIQRPN